MKKNNRIKSLRLLRRRKLAKMLSHIKYGKALRRNVRQELLPCEFRREVRKLNQVIKY